MKHNLNQLICKAEMFSAKKAFEDKVRFLLRDQRPTDYRE